MSTPRRTVQIRNPEGVMQAYENWKCAHFSIVNANQLLFAYDEPGATMEEGGELLKQWLTIINTSKSAAIYTLCVYKKLKGDIDNHTKYNGSVNFQFQVYDYGNSNNGMYPQVMSPEIKLLADQVSALSVQMQDLKKNMEAETDDEPEEDDFDRVMGKIESVMKNPLVGAILGAILPNAKGIGAIGQQKPVATDTTETVTNGKVTRIAGPNFTADQEQQIANSLKVLRDHVENLPAVLEKLALFVQKNPIQFKMYMGMLMAKKL